MTDDDKPDFDFLTAVARDVRTMTGAELIASIEEQGFEGEAGPLENCLDWIEIKRRLGAPGSG